MKPLERVATGRFAEMSSDSSRARSLPAPAGWPAFPVWQGRGMAAPIAENPPIADIAQGPESADVVVIGAGLAGLVAACEAAEAGRSVLVLDQEPGASLGGQAYWSLGGLFLVDSPEQRRLGIKDSLELA